jgi:serine/threonine protein phosphatase PrpC
VAFEAGDIVLLCTDGLVEGLANSHLEEYLRSPEAIRADANPAGRLVDESLARHGRDNTTALVIRVV